MGLLDRLGKGLGANQVGKTVDLVDDLWDHRKEIVKAVGWVRDHGDELVKFMNMLPQLLAKVGDAMDGAGNAAKVASGFLGGEDKDDDGGKKLVGTNSLLGLPGTTRIDPKDQTVSTLASLAGDSLGRAHTQIGSMANVLSDLSGLFDKVPLVGERLSSKTGEGQTAVDRFSDEMSELAAQLAHIAKRVGVVSGHLTKVGDGLIDSSAMLKSLT